MKLRACLAALMALAAAGCDESRQDEPAPAQAPPARTAPAPAVATVWGVEDAAAAARRLRRHRAVRRATVVRRGIVLLRSGRVPAGYAIPLDVVSVRPREFAATVPQSLRDAVAGLERGEALLSRTSARLRRVEKGARLRLENGSRVRVAGVVPDEVAQSAELLVADSARMPSSRDSVVATLEPGARVTMPALARIAGGDGRARLIDRPRDEAPDGWQGPARQAELKARFGEPAVGLPYGDDWVRLDPGFRRRELATRRVPVLGSVTCHRKMLPALRKAMAELSRRGLGRLVDPGDYAGCYAPRRIRPGGALSLHAWGLAVDLNASANPFGGRSRQDRRLIGVMERYGFTWGGDFPTSPDPMHFEFRGRGA